MYYEYVTKGSYSCLKICEFPKNTEFAIFYIVYILGICEVPKKKTNLPYPMNSTNIRYL